ncbi:hypothetical protein BGX23_005729 [Mortierella sp. AD031]|nr:hypothetical protein BGX23_005729 [Mortierella sp. AD031]
MNFDNKSAPLDEQATFGNQAPFASTGPSAPHDPYFTIPADVPPMYSEGPSPLAPRDPQTQTYLPPSAPQPRAPQHAPSSPYPLQPQQSPYPSYLPPAGQPPSGPVSAYPQQQQQQQPYYPPQQQPFYGAGPSTNYGATSNGAPSPFPHNNNLPNHQGYYYDNTGKPYVPVATGPHPSSAPSGRRGSVSSDSDCSSNHHRRSSHRRKRKKSGNCCTCCCLTILFIFLYCWYLVRSFAFPDYSCSATDDYESTVDVQYLTVVPGLNYKYMATEEITGNIEVNESDEWDQKDIRIRVVKKAASKSVLDLITHTLKEVDGTHVSRIHLDDSLSKKAKERIGRSSKSCVNADVQITYPRSPPPPPSSSSLPSSLPKGLLALGSLDLSTISGQISVKMKKNNKGYSLDSLAVEVVNGDLEIENLVVERKTKVEITNGQVSGNLTTTGEVETGIVNGAVDLAITTTPEREERPNWNPGNLNIMVKIVNGPVTLTLRDHFHGHFALDSLVGKPTFDLPPEDRITTTSKPGKKLEGWISENGKEPPGALPKLTIQSVVGAIKIKVKAKDEKNA